MYTSEGAAAAVTTGNGAMNCFKIGKGRSQSFVLVSCLFNFCVENTMKQLKSR